MERLKVIQHEEAPPTVQQLYEAVHRKAGMVPQIYKVVANSPAALQGLLQLTESLSDGVLPAPLRERVALAVSELNGCSYCLAAHSALARQLGLSESDISDSRRGAAEDNRVQAVLTFVTLLVKKHGDVTEEDMRQLRNAGFTDAEIVELVAAVALTTFTNYFNHVANTTIDFAPAEALSE